MEGQGEELYKVCPPETAFTLKTSSDECHTMKHGVKCFNASVFKLQKVDRVSQKHTVTAKAILILKGL